MRNLIVSALAVSLLAGTVAPSHAADSRRDDHRHERRSDDRGRDQRRSQDRSRGYDNRRVDSLRYDRKFDSRYYRGDRRFYPGYRYIAPRRFYAGAYYRPFGYRYYAWRRGDRLPRAYYSTRYLVRDYRAYRLYAPPRGYHWVRVGNDVVLAAITTGIVLGVVNNLFY